MVVTWLNQGYQLLVCLYLVWPINGRQECSWVTGQLKCLKDQRRVLNSEIWLIDRDGVSIFDDLDRDDMMGKTYPNGDGSFRVEGCAGDHDWVPFYANLPEPYIQIYHYCNDPVNGQMLKLPEFQVFQPHTYVIKEPIVLDD